MNPLMIQLVLFRRYVCEFIAGLQLFIGVRFEISWDAGFLLHICLPFGGVQLKIVDMKPYIPAMRAKKRAQDKQKSAKRFKRRQK